MKMKVDQSGGRAASLDARHRRAPGLALHDGAIFADEQLEMLPLLVRELQEDPLALGVLEAFAVSLEETMRATLAPDADHQGLAIVHALRQLLRARREQAVGRPLE